MPGTRRVSAAQQARQAATHATRVRRVVEEACNQGDLAVLDALLAPPTCTETPPAPGRLRQGLAAFRAAVPDARWTIVQQVAAGDTVVTRLAVQGTFSGPLVGLAPPGRAATLTGVAISRFAEGRLVELWLQPDLLGFLQQLEVLPPLRLTQAVTLAQMLQVAASLAEDLAPAPPEPPPRAPGGAPAAIPDHPASP